jgi:Gram-negative bacterial TonB protein C-terminal
MKPTFGLLVFLLVSCISFGQDLQLRQQAVSLLERANAVSVSPNFPSLERTVTFRVLDSATGPQQGTFTREVVRGSGRRDEVTFGSFHMLNVYTQGQLATVRTSELLPPAPADALRLTPINLVRFDDEDVIYAINDSVTGGHPARCIEFNTIVGETNENNELCVDSNNGTLIREKIGDQLIENGDFFSFAGALIPGKIGYSYGGVPKLEITQTMTALDHPAPDILATPPNAEIRQICKTSRRAFGQYMPQPKPTGSGTADILLRGIIGKDGKVHDAMVQRSERPDLNAQALSIIQQWTFSPAMCDGEPNETDANFVLHFR